MKNELSQDDNVMSRVVPIIRGTRLSSGHVDPKDVATFGWGQGPADIAVFGDRHAAHLFDGIVSETLLRRHRVQFFLNYCSPPVLNLSSWNIGGVQYNEDVVSILCNDDRIKVVILAANWTAYLKGAPYFASQAHLLQFKNEDVPPDKTFATMRSELTRTLKELRSHGKRVYVLEPLPDYGLDVLNTLQRCSVTNRDAYNYINTSRSLYLSRHAATIELLRQASSDSGCTVIPSAEALWNGTRFMLQENDISFYADHHHLSAYGSRRVAPFIFDHIVFP